ncbi:4'-phosphopantetheinyl transferase superfamily protein [Paenibacillus lutrae]|uniref:4'-phosphopantetheinyl transferase superfamily protein n=1 Tax=Paenibacillus lutrae TaxID=2078573 RepID=A0A7X3FIE2_9BACL|nr:4'-phosphopantetheinyl transferase superfamily protein [Paenibacillus lutrae]
MDIYAIKLKLDDEDELRRVERFAGCITEEKRAKAQRFVRAEDRMRAIAADVLARWSLCRKLNVPNAELQFSANAYGKPFLTGAAEECGYNVTHSGEWVAVAVADVEVGIDVEQIKPIDRGIAERFFSRGENEDLGRLRPEEQLDYFYDLWTLKESYIKAVGKGLSIPLGSFTLRKNGESIVLEPEETHFFKQYELDGPYKLSVCSVTREFPQAITLLELEDLRL